VCTESGARGLSLRLRIVVLGLVTGAALLPADVSAQTAGGGATHTIILKSDGTVWTVGGNGSGQIGDNTTTQRQGPYQSMPWSTRRATVPAGSTTSRAA